MRSLHRSFIAAAIAGAALLAACASPPAGRPTAAAPADCSAIGTEIAHAEEARRAATQKQDDAWKAVVPFAVAARYASGKAAVADADRQLAELRTESDRRGCTAPRG
jgi:hypothetical protein